MHLKITAAVLVAATTMAAGSPAMAAILQSTQVVTGLNSPTFVATAPNDSRYLYILEKGSGSSASIQVHDLVTHNTTPFLTINGVATGGEQGLLGLAFDPNYATNGNFYVNYNASTTISGAASVTTIAAYHANSATSAQSAALGTIFTTVQTDQTNHKGGWIGFSPRSGDDHNLYIALGDGGNGNDVGNGHIEPGGNAQNTTTHLGKILRIHIDPAITNTYTIPANNPFAASADPVKKEIFALGLRNPFRNSFDRATGNLFIADVGQGAREELDVQKATNPGGGENYGWRVREGFISTPTVGGAKTDAMTDPILNYAQNTGETTLAGTTIIGGYIYRGSAIPDLVGTYFFADAGGPQNVDEPRTEIFSLRYDGTAVSELTDLTSVLNPGATPLISSIVSFGEDAAGELYMVDIGNGSAGSGKIFKITAVPEPGTLALAAAGGSLLLARRRRR